MLWVMIGIVFLAVVSCRKRPKFEDRLLTSDVLAQSPLLLFSLSRRFSFQVPQRLQLNTCSLLSLSGWSHPYRQIL